MALKIGPKSVITFPSGGQRLPGAGFYEISGLAWSGAGAIHLGFMRVPIGASDFTKGGTPYSYDEVPRGQSDPSLARFSVSHDDAYVLPMLR